MQNLSMRISETDHVSSYQCLSEELLKKKKKTCSHFIQENHLVETSVNCLQPDI